MRRRPNRCGSGWVKRPRSPSPSTLRRKSKMRSASASPRKRSRSPVRKHRIAPPKSPSPLRRSSRSISRSRSSKSNQSSDNKNKSKGQSHRSGTDAKVESKSKTSSIERDHDQKENELRKTSAKKSFSRCKDFDEKGLCILGESCPFDHGNNPVVLTVCGDNNSSQGHLGDDEVNTIGLHHDPELMYVSNPNLQLQPPGPGDEYFPDTPSMGLGHWGHRHAHRPPSNFRPPMYSGMPETFPIMPLVSPRPPYPMMPMRGPPGLCGPPFPPPMHQPRYPRGGHGHFDRRRLGPPPSNNNFRVPPGTNSNCCLELRKIPVDRNNVNDIVSHFQKFGKIVNVNLNHDGDPHGALIIFGHSGEAEMALRATEAIMNNRFIRVYRLRGGVGSVGTGYEDQGQVNSASGSSSSNSNIIEVLDPKKIGSDKVGNEIKVEKERKKLEVMKISRDLKQRMQTIMEEQIQQQKKLIEKLESGKLKAQEKQETLKLLKVLEESVTRTKKDLEPGSSSSGSSKVKSVTVEPEPKMELSLTMTKDEIQKELLDAEMDLFKKEQMGEETAEIRERVEQLKVHAEFQDAKTENGFNGGVVVSDGGFGVFGMTRGFTRGRGHLIRGLSRRGGWRVFGGRGRGFPPRGSYRGRLATGARAFRTVDHRPSKIQVNGWPSFRLSELLNHLSRFGHIRDSSVDNNDTVIVEFDARRSAELAMASNMVLRGIELQMNWVNEAEAELEPEIGSSEHFDEVEGDGETEGELGDESEDEVSQDVDENADADGHGSNDADGEEDSDSELWDPVSFDENSFLGCYDD